MSLSAKQLAITAHTSTSGHVCLSLNSVVKLSTADWRQYTYNTYSARNFSGWPNMLKELESTAFAPQTTFADRIQLMAYYYGYIGHLLDVGDKDNAKLWNKRATQFLERVKKENSSDPRLLSLESMFIAYNIAITPLKAPLHVHSMMSTAKKALQKAPNLYWANLANANILFYFPEALGGDKHQAIEYYTRVYQYFKNNPDKAKDDWMYLNVMSTLGVANEAVGNIAKAEEWCRAALQIQPGFVFVNQVLLPRILKKQN